MSQKREWKTIKEYQDILFEFYNGIAKITINRPVTAMHLLRQLHPK